MGLPRRFYLRPAPVVARDLLGCLVVTRRGAVVTAGRIVETEAYLGPEDEASHAAFRPGSHGLLYGEGGRAYVYLNYGMHRLLNAVANPAGRPGCVLIRALEPVAGLGTMAQRRGVARGSARLATGPGNLTRALGITLGDNGADLTAGRLTIEPPDRPREFRIASGRRVGITRAVGRRLRFWIAGHPCVSGGPQGPQRSRTSASGSKSASARFVLTRTERTVIRKSSFPSTNTSRR